MKRYILALFTVILLSTTICAQGFKVKATGVQTFSFKDDQGRNQGTFHSTTPLEDVDGTANNITGTVAFDVANFAKTLKGKIIVEAASINTGINLRNEHMKSANWLDVKQYPDITFEIKSVSDVKQIADNKLTFKVTGAYTMHGVSKDVTADAEAIYLDENEQTQQRAPGGHERSRNLPGDRAGDAQHGLLVRRELLRGVADFPVAVRLQTARRSTASNGTNHRQESSAT